MKKTKFYLNFLVLLIFNLKSGLILFDPDQLQWTLLKDVAIIFGEQAKLIHAMFISIGMVTILGKLVIFYHESRKKFKVNDMIVDWKARKPMYRISESHLKKLTLRAFFLYHGYIKLTGFIGIVIVNLIGMSVTITTYLYHDYGNVIILWFWTILFIITVNQMKNILLIGTLLCKKGCSESSIVMFEI